MFKLNNVRYKNIVSVDELSIDEGQTTCIVGESGSGKTTMLKLLNHMIDYSEGSIFYKGSDLKNLDAVLLRREVILLPQVPVIFPGTVRDNLLIGLSFAKKEPVTDERLLEELAKVGLQQKELDEDAEPLSGGEKQRLALIRVILMEPEVLLLDEPTSAVDDDTEDKITAYINDYLAAGNRTLVLVTHSKPLARSMGKKIVTVYNGRITDIEEVA
ncbi:MAG: ATP-binding cassette domain-containing protein [Bacillota bacterium]|nr:ATP-binding cassette domain-containing protein [Bacillota bacterium]